jgi:hypothetical protein
VEIARPFGQEIADIVLELTDEPTVAGGPNRTRRKLKDRERLALTSTDAQSIKCLKMISDTSSIMEAQSEVRQGLTCRKTGPRWRC